jgi:predicted PurR-regulated permease PerM
MNSPEVRIEGPDGRNRAEVDMVFKQEEVRPLKSRGAFLLLLALVITVAFYWVIAQFLLTLLLAAVLAGMVHPLYSRLRERFGGRSSLAAGITVALSLVIVIIPLLLFVGVLVGEAVSVSEGAARWFTEQVGPTGELRTKLAEDPDIQRLLPYQDEIVAKISQMTANAGSFVAQGLALGARGTAEFFLLVFVLLFAVFTFLVDGESMLREVLRFTPLSETDKKRLLGTYVSVGRATIKGTLVIGIMQGGLAGLAFWVAGIQGAIFWGVVMTVLSIIPGIGTALVWVPAVVFLALDGQVVAAVGVALWCALVVGTIDNVLRPILVGKDIQMPDLLVMLTTLGGLSLFGATGILVGPLIGALYLTVWRMWGSAIDEAEGAVHVPQTPNDGDFHD